MATKKIGKWDGGYIGQSNTGTITYYIRKTLNDKTYTISLKTDNKQLASKLYDQFRENPEDFTVNGVVVVEPLEFSDILIDKYIAAGKVKENANTEKHQREKRTILKEWQKKLGGPKTNLKLVELKHITRCVKPGMPGLRQRMVFLKSFMNWLLGEGELEKHPMLGVRGSKFTNKNPASRKAIKTADALKVIAILPGLYKSAYIVQLATAWHATEIKRFIENGKIDGNVLTTWHKRKDWHPVAVSPEALTEAKKLKLGGKAFSLDTYADLVRAATQGLGLEKAGPGNVRPTVVTAAIEAGHTPGEVQQLTGHTSMAMINKIYNQAKPRKIHTMT